MNIYRIHRLGRIDNLPAGTPLEVIIEAESPWQARAVIVAHVQMPGGDDERSLWVDASRTRVAIIGASIPEEDETDESDQPYIHTVSRQVAKAGETHA